MRLKQVRNFSLNCRRYCHSYRFSKLKQSDRINLEIFRNDKERLVSLYQCTSGRSTLIFL